MPSGQEHRAAVLERVVRELTQPGAVGAERVEVLAPSAGGERDPAAVRRGPDVEEAQRAREDGAGLADRDGARRVEREPLDRVGAERARQDQLAAVTSEARVGGRRERDSERARAGRSRGPSASSIATRQRLSVPPRSLPK